MKLTKKNKKRLKNLVSMKFKTWWKKHWDEVMLIVGISIAIGLVLKGNGVF